MPKFRIWRYEQDTSWAEVEAEDDDAALNLTFMGDQDLTWTSTRYDAEYDVELASKPITENRAAGMSE